MFLKFDSKRGLSMHKKSVESVNIGVHIGFLTKLLLCPL